MSKSGLRKKRLLKLLLVIISVPVVIGGMLLLKSRLYPLFDDQIKFFVEESVHQAVLRQLSSKANSPLLPPSLPSPITNNPKLITNLSPTPPPAITEADLWNALTTYRQAHQMNSLVLEEPLCAYARARVKELEDRLPTLSVGDSPLDAHAGFKRDADSKKLFNDTGFPAVAENLAFLPKYINATEIIEWGWDSSSSHRDTQLSNDWTHACIAGTFPFYVGIFAHR